jgi:hypothetical protein
VTPIGRLSVLATPPVPVKQYERESYSVEFKISVLDFLDKNDMKSTLDKFFSKLNPIEKESKRKAVYKWRKDRCKLENSGGDNKTMKIRPLGFTCILPVDMELYLARWIYFLRSDGIPVSNKNHNYQWI